ncbi:MAG: GNAT family N-acetyltransferase [Chloroflexi bacterium]|nr:GNAT family N-acetyltransferase [Chloroflexota bacterium]
MRSDVPQNIAEELNGLAAEEPAVSDFRVAPVYAERYLSLLRGKLDTGPAFTFPEEVVQPSGTVFIEDIESLDHHFTGWKESEIPIRTPIVAFVEGGYAVSACFSAWRSDAAAEAGLETAAVFRGRGFGPRVTAGWALAIRASGRVPLYSTSWSNDASLAVARKLGLVTFASRWSIH